MCHERLVPVTRNSRLENVWWTYSYVPIEEEGGGGGGVLVVCNDVTAQHLAREALANQTEYLRRIFNDAPGFMAVLRGPDHVFELTNASYKRLTGNRGYLGRRARDVFPEVEGQGFFELLDEAYRTGKTHVGRRVPLTMQSSADEVPEQRWIDFVYAPILDAARKTTAVFIEGVDVTDQMHSEDRLRLV